MRRHCSKSARARLPVGATLWLLALLVLWACSARFAMAGKQAYGEEFFRADSRSRLIDVPPGLSNTDPPPPSTAAASANEVAQQQRLDEIEQMLGPYSDALAEPLAGLGRSYHNRGELAKALATYRRALQVVRINDGLYSERQTPILRALLDIHRSSGDLQALDARYDYFFRLYGNGQPPYTELRMRAALAYLRWQREALRLHVDADPARRLLNLYRLNEDLLESVALDAEADRRWRSELTLSQVRNLYLLSDRYEPRLEELGTPPASPLAAQDWQEEDFYQRRLENLHRGSLSRGAALLRQAIDAGPGAGDGLEKAALYLELGDWYQWHGRFSSAGEHYAMVVSLLEKAGRPDLLQTWLGEPVELPDNGAFWQPRESDRAETAMRLGLQFDVSERGRAGNFVVLEADPERQRLTARLQRKLAGIRFRPRWVNGSPEAVSKLRRDYAFYP